ncbi:MAG: sigma-70 family RNA polymerase sigma factor [Planctomycetes bacterium]|nr:sigma-70 family RNA polymerase sigma factor [Planctomycetota bacterium]
MASPEFTRAFFEHTRGDRVRAEDILPLVYDELRRFARARIARERPGYTLQPTALVHEAYLQLVGDVDPGWDSRRHFFASAARAMQRILVDRARRKMASKRGGGRAREEDVELDGLASPAPDEVLHVDELVERLERDDARKAQIVRLRYFAGLTVSETAHAMELSVGTIEREWRFLRAMLRVTLDDR